MLYVDDEAVCEAILVDDQFILTTGSCMNGLQDHGARAERRGVDATSSLSHRPRVSVRLGTHILQNMAPHEQVRTITHWRAHPDYNFRPGTPGRFLVQKDLALAQLNRPVIMSEHVRPACLPPSQV